ncbi:lipase class 3 [Nitzschia inconspicua]|uniref:Lipase class 3 n=1 Tax=Nitzschia inconspicua TaxID=303405 RepID=A0A9K3PRX2_9STRA|nr:lipase class 3 [Nitzschia inconspicua]
MMHRLPHTTKCMPLGLKQRKIPQQAVSRRYLSLAASKNKVEQRQQHEKQQRYLFPPVTVFLSSVLVTSIGISWYVREWRENKLQELQFVDSAEGTSDSSSSLQPPQLLPRSTQEILQIVERTGLMGRPGAKSVKDELEDIRQWHVERGYKGGLVLRELLQPLFEHRSDPNQDISDNEMQRNNNGIITLEDLANPNLARRECYYLYYEIKPNGEIKHDIFCRGTTLSIDIWTSLTTWMEYDQQLDCRVHMGFNRQATHILEDILPLMAPPGPRTTVRVSGHSLGGAVAYLLAAKLKLKGYRVTEVTGVEAPRVCASREAAEKLQLLLPNDTLRIENDTDPVPLLPPFGHCVGNKLYLVDSIGKAAYLTTNDTVQDKSWTDSVFINARLWEIVSSRGQTHRIRYILPQLTKALGQSNDSQ